MGGVTLNYVLGDVVPVEVETMSTCKIVKSG